ncbi:MAG: RNA polymerase sigma factor [Acidimicrobiales bacterium]
MLLAIEPSDDILTDRARRGDRAALDQLLRRHYDRIHAICFRIAGNPADAADACQEAVLAVVRGLPRFDGRSSFSTWSYRVATNACLDEMRRKNRRPRPVEDLVEAAPAAGGRSVGDQVTERITVDEALAELPEIFRWPVVLRDMVGMDYAEIAAALDLAPGTVRSRIARGRRHLATRLAGEREPDEVSGTSETTS